MRKLIVFLLSAVLLLVLVSCTSSELPPASGGSEPIDGEPEITAEPSGERDGLPSEAPTAEPTAAPADEYPLPEDPEAAGDCVKDAEIIAHLPIGDGDDCLSFIPAHDNYEDDEGPNAFALADGKVYVLDLMNHRVVVYEDGELSFIPFSDRDTHDHYTAMAVVGGSIYLVGTTGGEREVAVYDMSGERTGSIPLPDGTDPGAYALYEEDGSLMLLTNDLEAFRLKDGVFVVENGFHVSDPRVVNGSVTVSVDGADIRLDAGESTALGVYRIVNGRIFCIGYGAEVSYRVYDLNGELLGATAVEGSSALYYPISSMFVSSEGELCVMTCMKDGVYITMPHLRK
ncbi:MAG: hypothetical protein IKG85_04270 [Clostridia bacterium]|nr:hypothetical protein [Clostridia bacterium]